MAKTKQKAKRHELYDIARWVKARKESGGQLNVNLAPENTTTANQDTSVTTAPANPTDKPVTKDKPTATDQDTKKASATAKLDLGQPLRQPAIAPCHHIN